MFELKASLRRIRHDISRGKNVVNALMILAAVVVPALHLTKVLPAEGVILTLLPVAGLLLANSLQNQWLLHDLNQWLLGDLRGMIEGLGVGAAKPSVKIHKDWKGEVFNALSSAKKSVVVVTSWAVDAAHIGDCVHDAARASPNERITVEVFMLDPDRPFGAQRYGEVYEHEKDATQPHWEAEYRSRFGTSVSEIKRRLVRKGVNAELTVYRYWMMPAVKVYTVDDERFFFGWLSAAGPSTNNVCLELVARSGDPNVDYVIGRIREHLTELRRKSTPEKFAA